MSDRLNIDGDLIVTADLHGFHNNILLYCNRSRFMTKQDLELLEAYKLYSHDRMKWQEWKRSHNLPRISDEATSNMNEYMIEKINEKVKDPDRDTLVIVGDFVFGNSNNQYLRNARYFREKIHCRDTRIVWGNHDRSDLIANLFNYTYDYVMLTSNSGKYPQNIFFSHYPMVAWEGSHRGIPLCYGHVHGLYTKKDHPHPMARPELWAAIDVGVDTNDFQPYSLCEILDELDTIFHKQKVARSHGKEHHMY